MTREEFAAALRASEKTGSFDALRYVNAFPAKKHDHFLIPGGTIHCSGANCMVLEISATPYIFTFKMWDWGRVEHALANIQFDRDTEWVRKNLVGRVETISERPGVKEERDVHRASRRRSVRRASVGSRRGEASRDGQGIREDVKMEFDPGFDITPTTPPMGFRLGPDCFDKGLEVRKLDAIRKSLRNPQCDGPEDVYAIMMDVGRTCDREEIVKRNLLFGVVTYAAGRLGDEPPEDYPQLGISRGESVYSQFVRDNDRFLWVARPALKEKEWKKFVP